MELPQVKYNQELYEHIRTMRRDRKAYMLYDLEPLGEGAAGLTFTAFVKPEGQFPDQVVLKEQSRNRFCNNEFEALKFLREKLIAGEFPGYFIFMYGCFTSGGKKYIILEKADHGLDDYLTEYNADTKTILQIFYHIARAVSYLEKEEFNHGDLWSENVMLSWLPDQEDIPEEEREFTIKVLDFDSAYKSASQIKNPSYGGADYFRTKFILGYDLNRFFDGLIYSYESYIKKKTATKKRTIARLRRLKKQGKKVTIPRMEDPDKEDEAFDAENIIYPQEIIDFMHQLKPRDPNYFKDCPEMSGEAVMKAIENYAVKLDIDLFDCI